MKSILNLLVLSLVLITACKKEEDDHDHVNTTDTEKPVVNISKPTAMQVFYSGDTVRINATATDASLHEMVIKITKDSDGSVLFQETPTVHDLTSYTIDTYWKSQVSDHTNATLVILAEDHSSNVGSDTVHIHIMP